jgi:hypothetical protein
MSLIQPTVLVGIADRLSYQYGVIAVPFASINITGSGLYETRVTATDDVDVELPLLQTYYNVDTTTFNLATMIRGGLSGMMSIISAMDAHFARVGHRGGWDSYLDATGYRVSDYFNQVYYLGKSQFMLANNVFSETANSFATWTYAGGFVNGIDYGNGSWLNKADGLHFAPTQLKAIVDVGSTSCSSLILQLSVKDITNSPTTINVTITGAAGTEVDIGTTSNRFLDVTNITVISGSASGNAIRIENKKERQVAP